MNSLHILADVQISQKESSQPKIIKTKQIRTEKKNNKKLFLICRNAVRCVRLLNVTHTRVWILVFGDDIIILF